MNRCCLRYHQSGKIPWSSGRAFITRKTPPGCAFLFDRDVHGGNVATRKISASCRPHNMSVAAIDRLTNSLAYTLRFFVGPSHVQQTALYMANCERSAAINNTACTVVAACALVPDFVGSKSSLTRSRHGAAVIRLRRRRSRHSCQCVESSRP